MRAGQIRRPLADLGAQQDQARPVYVLSCFVHELENTFEIIGIPLQHLPGAGLEAGRHIIAEAEPGAAVNRDRVGIVEHDQLAQAEVPGQRRRLVADSFHQISVTRQCIGVVIDDRVLRRIEPCSHHPFRNGQPHGIGESLSERAGGRLHTGLDASFRVSGCLRTELAEALDILKAQVVAGQEQKRVEHHGAVPR